MFVKSGSVINADNRIYDDGDTYVNNNPVPKLDPRVVNTFLAKKLLGVYDIPKALSGIAPRELLGRNNWETVKKSIRKNNRSICQLCGRKVAHFGGDWYVTHEEYSFDLPGRVMHFEAFVGLCWHCHLVIHERYMKYIMDKGILSRAKAIEVWERGQQIREAAGLKRTPKLTKDEDNDPRWQMEYNDVLINRNNLRELRGLYDVPEK